MTSHGEAWFSALGEPLGDAERSEIAAYLSGLAMPSPVHAVRSWQEAFQICVRPAEAWWNAEEAARDRLEHKVKLNPAEPQWLSLHEALRPIRRGSRWPRGLRRTIRSCASTPYTAAGGWPLGVYQGRFAIF